MEILEQLKQEIDVTITQASRHSSKEHCCLKEFLVCLALNIFWSASLFNFVASLWIQPEIRKEEKHQHMQDPSFPKVKQTTKWDSTVHAFLHAKQNAFSLCVSINHL